MMTLSKGILNWLATEHTGESSKSLVAVLGNDETLKASLRYGFSYPLDPSDFGRCLRVLEIEPEFRTRLHEMSSIHPVWARYVAHWDELEALYRAEYPTGHAPQLYDRMHELRTALYVSTPRTESKVE